MGQWLGAGSVCEDSPCESEDEIIGPFQWKKEEGGNDHWYAIVVTDPLCWVDADVVSRGNNGYLATLTTAEEYAWWIATFGGTGQEPYIGLRQLQGASEPADGWEWVTGEGETYSQWVSGSPNDETGEANVAQMLSSGYWDDVTGCTTNSYAIEFGQWYNVCETCEYTTIQEAVNDASNVETIYVGAGTYTSVDGISLVDLLGKDISLVGAGADSTILDGQYAVSGLDFAYGPTGNAYVEGVTIQHCVDRTGSAIVVRGGTLEIANCVFTENQAVDTGQSGGALSASGGTELIISSSEFTNNVAVAFGGGVNLQGSGTNATITDCLFANNESTIGGAICVADGTTCSGDLIEFTENIAGDGGAVSITGDGSSLLSCCFQSNNALGVGGAIDNRAGANTQLTDCLFTNNSAVYEGGAIYNDDSTPVLYQCTLASNISYEEHGGGMHNDGDSMPFVESTLFCGNTGRGGSESALEGHIYPTVADSDYEFVGGNEFHALCSTCQGDINGDGEIDLTDLIAIAMISVWGECNECLADLDNNGVVDPDDIVILIELLTSRLDRPCDIDCPYRY
jgi:predicted outer membrane repeat protein